MTHVLRGVRRLPDRVAFGFLLVWQPEQDVCFPSRWTSVGATRCGFRVVLSTQKQPRIRVKTRGA